MRNVHKLKYFFATKSILSLFVILLYGNLAYAQDFDGDGIQDTIDLDDDNDGILDADENGCNNPSDLIFTNITVGSPTATEVISNSGVDISFDIVLTNQGTQGFESGPEGNFALGDIFDTATDASGGDALSISADTPVTYILSNKTNGSTGFDDGDYWRLTALGGFDISDPDGQLNVISNSGNIIHFRPAGNINSNAGTWQIYTTRAVQDILIEANGNPWTPARLQFCHSLDTDGDGTPDEFDLDSDNDGILDAIEAGHGQAQTNGTVNGAVGNDGVPNLVQSDPNGGTVNYMLAESNEDADSIFDFLDLDSDGDGIPDNVEGQTTIAYTPPNADNAATYVSNNGINSAYLGGITPTNTDGLDLPDYLDTDSDNEGGNDAAEANIMLSNSDADNDGLDDATDATGDYSDVGGTIDNPLTAPAQLPDTDSDATMGGDVDFRDATDDRPDNDNDGVPDVVDFDDDNDGILDTNECTNPSAPAFIDWVSFNALQIDGILTVGSESINVTGTGNLSTFTGSTVIDETATYFDNPSIFTPTVSPSDAVGVVLDAGGSDFVFDFGGETVIDPIIHIWDIADNRTISFGTSVTILSSNPQISLQPDGQSIRSSALIGGGTFQLIGQFTTITVTQTEGAADTSYFHFASFGLLNDGVVICDSDGDGTRNSFDLDSDNDGIFDAVEAGHNQGHTNGVVNGTVGVDGIPDAVQTDPDGGLTNYTLAESADDSDTIFDFLDLDADGDGIPDNVEAQTTIGYIAPNGTFDANGVDTAYPTGITPTNTDGTDLPDYLDSDSDNEGGTDTVEANITLSTNDTDNDGLDDATDATADYTDVGGTIDHPLNAPVILPDSDSDAFVGGDVDYRDATSEISTPFLCDGTLFQTVDISGQIILHEINAVDASFTQLANLTANGLLSTINSIGFNPVDNYIYGIQPNPPYRLYRIDSNYNVLYLGNISGLSGQNTAGVFDTDGTYYLSGSSQELYSVDINSRTATLIGNTGFNTSDITINPTNGEIYGWANGQRQLFSIDKTNASVTFIGSPNTQYALFGSMFYDNNNNIIAYGDDTSVTATTQESLVVIDPITGIVSPLATGQDSTSNDGCSCVFTVEIDKSAVDSIDLCSTNSIAYTYTIYNSSGVVLNDVNFQESLLHGLTYGSEPYNVDSGLSFTASLLGQSSSNMVFQNIPLGVSSFTIDVLVPSNYTGPVDYTNDTFIDNLDASAPSLPTRVDTDDPNTLIISDNTVVAITATDTNNDTIPDCFDLDTDDDGIVNTEEKDCSGYSPIDLSAITDLANSSINDQPISAVPFATNFSSAVTANHTSTEASRPEGLANGDLRLYQNNSAQVSEYRLDFDHPTSIQLSQAELNGAFEAFETWTIVTTGGSISVSNPVINVVTDNGTSWNDTELDNITGDLSNRVTFSPKMNASDGNISVADSEWSLTAENINSLIIRVQTSSPGDNAARIKISANCVSIDTDGDGLPNDQDLDSDNDGIPDNVEAQTTTGYIAPSLQDTNRNGLDDAYESGFAVGLIPVNNDGTDNPDYLDLDSDNEGGNDTAEANITLSNNDADNDGLDDATDATPDYSDVGGTIDNPLTAPIILPDSDNDATTGGDVDFRDSTNPGDGVAFTNTTVSVIEGDTAAENVRLIFEVTYTGVIPPSEEISLQYRTILGTATDGTDIIALNGALAWTATTSRLRTIEIEVLEELLVEADEDFTIELFNLTTLNGFSANFVDNALTNTARGVIINDDTMAGGEGISVADFTVNEDIGTVDFVVTYTGPTVADAFSVDYAVADGTAISPDDYTVAVATGSVSFPANTTTGSTQTVTVTIIDDAILEASEDLIITLSNISNSLVVMLDANGVGTITDNEMADIDSDDDGILDSFEDMNTDGDDDPTTNATDSDGDLVPDYLDIDSDNDGIPDNVESQTTSGYIPPSLVDANDNGLDDAYENGIDLGLIPINTDSADLPDYLDDDSDNDSILDNIEAHDFNQDGVADVVFIGLDSDDDGLDDGFEGAEQFDVDVNDEIDDPINDLPDTDSNGESDYRDVDDDGDGIPTMDEDTDGDMNYVNDDWDNDGIPDYLDPDMEDELEEVEVFNVVTPNGDGIHDFLTITGLSSRPDNTLRIFNRWGILVYTTTSYGTQGNFFDGTSQARVTIGEEEGLPVGTYFYLFDYVEVNGETINLSGYLYLN